MEGDDNRIYITRTKPVLTREQKTGFVMVTAFGALALVFGVFYIWKHVASPFVVEYTGPRFLTGDEVKQQEMANLQKEDTDGDGIDDYSELYVYKTSPYLADSDSDGSSDQAEIKGGTDPNCAVNMPCATLTADKVNPTTLKGTFVEEVIDATGAVVSAGPPETIAPDYTSIADSLAQMTADEIRQLLIDSGGDPTAINALTDEEVRIALAQAFALLESETSTTDSSQPSTP